MFKAWEQRKAKKRYKEFEAWLDVILASWQLPNEVVAINFNIYDGAADIYDVEMIGAPSFDENDDDWACDELYTSDLLSLPAISAAEDWEKGLYDIIEMVREYMHTGHHRDTLESYEAVGVGHVNGDIVVVHRGAPVLPENLDMAQDVLPCQDPAEENSPAFILPPVTAPAAIELISEGELAQEEVPQSLFESSAADFPSPAMASPPADIFPAVTASAPAAIFPAVTASPPAECFKLLREMRPKNICCVPKQEYGIRQYELSRGVPFSGWNEDFTFVYQEEKGGIATDLLNNSMGWLLVSQQLRAFLEEAESQIEYFPVKVEKEGTGEVLPGYCVANLLRVHDALSLEESEFSVVTHPVYGSYNSIKKYALRGEALCGAEIFKLSQHQEIPVFVTDCFKNKMLENGITGMAYFPVKLV